MILNKVCASYFSPTGTTKSVLKAMLEAFDAFRREEIDLTPFQNKDKRYSFNENDLLIIGTPVYGGRVPSAAEERLKLLKGNGASAVLVVTYGNIHYDNALFELHKIVSANDFFTIGAAAVVSEHNVVNKHGRGRPNERDLALLSDFTEQIKEKIARSEHFENIIIKGEAPTSKRNKTPIIPHGNNRCANCGACVKLCPVGAIDNPRKKAGKACIRCMRCVKYCRRKARTYGKIMKVGASLLLSANGGSVEKQPDFYI